jgi:alkylated DNA nucleotide flippase Atl1
MPLEREVAVQDEQMFTVDGTVASPAVPITLADAGMREREHLQEWIVANPAILGDDIRIVTFEFDRWLSGSADSDPRDRLDVLGLDPSGTLVVAELKRDRAAATVEMQALKYAAMVSRFTGETLAAAHAAHLTRQQGRSITAEEALAELEEHAGGELDPTVLRRPRIVLVASEFPRTTTATCVWLSEMMGDDAVTLVRYQAYRAGSEVVVTTSQLWPIATVEDFTVSPRLVEAREAARSRAQRRRATSAVARLVEADALEAGTVLRLRPTTEVDAEVRGAIEVWVAEEPARGRAAWTGQSPDALRWEADARTYTPGGLARHIIAEAAGVEHGPRGTAWWATEDGEDLVVLADALAPSGARRPFDWSALHQLLEGLPAGRWTTYGDLADQVGTAAQPLGGHLKNCTQCPSGWRVLDRDGRERIGFVWSDPSRTETQVEALTAEGVRFDGSGRADSSQRMDWSATS